jgi:predicted peptidase
LKSFDLQNIDNNGVKSRNYEIIRINSDKKRIYNQNQANDLRLEQKNKTIASRVGDNEQYHQVMVEVGG